MGERLVVLLLGQRVDRAELLAAARRAARCARAAAAASSSAERLLGGLGGQAEPLGERAQLLVGLGGLVARLLGADLGLRDRLVARAQAALDLGLLLRAGAQLGGDALALGAVGGELGLERLELRGGAGG